MENLNIEEVSKIFESIKNELKKSIKGQDEVIENVLIAIFCGGHILLEGVPGLGKTLLVNSLSRIIGGKFKRIQFTPDLMPSDIIGTTVFNTEVNKFQIKKGPVFTNLLLADEINRAPAKTQSALLQAMQEKEVTIDGINYELENFFICFATQNPIEMEGTYPLPEAQVDRFLMKIFIDYPGYEDEQSLLKAYRNGFSADKLGSAGLKQVIDINTIVSIVKFLETITIDDKIIDYILKIVSATRDFPGIEVGSSPRGSVSLLQASRVKAVMNKRDFVIPDDIKDLAFQILRHRIILDPESEIEGETTDDTLKRIIEKIEVPR
jgi:MoxR-like ATPase